MAHLDVRNRKANKLWFTGRRGGMGQQGADAGLDWGCSGLSGVTVAPEVVTPCGIQIGASDVAQPLESRLVGCTPGLVGNLEELQSI